MKKLNKTIVGIILTSALATAGGDIVPVEEEVLAPTVTAPAVVENSAWQHKLTIYGWLPTFKGTLTYTLPDGNEQESDASLIDNLDGIFMGTYEVKKGKWSFLTDAIYLGLSGEETLFEDVGRGRLATAISEDFEAWIVSVYGGYNIIDTGSSTLDVIAGMRYFSMGIDADISFPNNPLPTISLSPSFEVYDALIGVKGHFDINENWYVPYVFDVGAGDTDLTWQAQASIGYRFGWGDVIATYRYLHYEKDDLRLVEDFDLYGPKVGVVFHF